MIITMKKKTIVVVGAGQGLGNHIAERFAKDDFTGVKLQKYNNKARFELSNLALFFCIVL